MSDGIERERMSSPKSNHISWHQGHVTRERRAELLGHGSAVVWLTGLSGSGKSTLGRYVEHLLIEKGVHAYVLDGDNIRFGLNRDLGFSPADRTENIRRIGEVAKLMVDAGMIVLTAFISPYREDRDAVRRMQTAPQDFFEVFVDAPLDVCEARDPKGLYKRARAGEIPEFTGISAPYEEPLSPELVLRTAEESLGECAERVVALLRQHGLVRS